MSLIVCSVCKQEISDSAIACPGCGHQRVSAAASLYEASKRLFVWPLDDFVCLTRRRQFTSFALLYVALSLVAVSFCKSIEGFFIWCLFAFPLACLIAAAWAFVTSHPELLTGQWWLQATGYFMLFAGISTLKAQGPRMLALFPNEESPEVDSRAVWQFVAFGLVLASVQILQFVAVLKDRSRRAGK